MSNKNKHLTILSIAAPNSETRLNVLSMSSKKKGIFKVIFKLNCGKLLITRDIFIPHCAVQVFTVTTTGFTVNKHLKYAINHPNMLA